MTATRNVHLPNGFNLTTAYGDTDVGARLQGSSQNVPSPAPGREDALQPDSATNTLACVSLAEKGGRSMFWTGAAMHPARQTGPGRIRQWNAPEAAGRLYLSLNGVATDLDTR